jgi:hypothetical protein
MFECCSIFGLWWMITSFIILSWRQPFLNFEDHRNFVQPYTVSPNTVCKSACTSSTVVMRLIPNLTYIQCFFLFLTVHLSITLANDQPDAQILNTFITILCMFRAISCSSSGGQIVLTQHLVSSLSLSDDTRCCINTIWPPEDEKDIARNMYT